uniref:Uncharacterized protein n=1 Tax=Anopheles maculatus TaxID=74869 RepID=A0A182T594_9DIPT
QVALGTVKIESGSITVTQIQTSQPSSTVAAQPMPIATKSSTTQQQQINSQQLQQQQQGNQLPVKAPVVVSASSTATIADTNITIMKREPVTTQTTSTVASVLQTGVSVTVTTKSVSSDEQKRFVPSPVQQVGETTIVRTPTPTPSPGPMQQSTKQSSVAPISDTTPVVEVKKEPEITLGNSTTSVSSTSTTSTTTSAVVASAAMGPPASMPPSSAQTTPPIKSPLPVSNAELIVPASVSPTVARTTESGPSPVLGTATIKEEPSDSMSAEQAAKKAAELALELKKKKRREYQKNRRQMQIQSNKDNQHNQAKKKPKKSVKIEEDYDTCIDNLMGQLRQLPPMQILEPQLPRNYGVCSVFGTGDLSKFTNLKGYSIASGDLTGSYGDAHIPSVADFYNTKPFGIKDPPPEPTPVSIHRGFYDQEFAPIKFEMEDRQRYEFVRDRELDSPDTIISTSSPECIRWDSPISFPGLRLIKEEPADDDQTTVYRQMSPVIPILAPIPIRLRKGITLSADPARANGTANIADSNKENEGFKETLGIKSRFGPPTPLKDTSNVTVTLTLTSSAVDDIFGVLRDLANMLEIPPPTTYQIVDRTVSPTSQKLGLYRTKGKDGKEGTPIDIQTILNGSARFCRHCDVVIRNNIIIAKASEFSLLAANSGDSGAEELESEELYFCDEQCYLQFKCCPTNILDESGKSVVRSAAGGESVVTLNHKPDASVSNTETTGIVPEAGAVEIKQEVLDDDVDMEDGMKELGSGDRKKKHPDEGVDKDVQSGAPAPKQMKGVRYKVYTPNCFGLQRFKKPSEKEITETLFRMSITVTPSPKMPDDTRRCIFCH